MELSIKELVELSQLGGEPKCVEPSTAASDDLGLCIVVADRGFVYVGRTVRAERGDLLIRNAANVRRWGTTKGLGQLAAEGPQPSTKLDTGKQTVRVPASSVVLTIDCNEEVWDGKLD